MVSNEEISRRLAMKRKGLNPDEELKKATGNICSKCKTANLENAKYCIGCGSELNKPSFSPKINEIKSNSINCPDCGSGNKSGSKFCIGCGSSLVETNISEPEEIKSSSVICPECNFENNPDSKFCVACGGGLAETSVNGPENEVVPDSVICPECKFENNLNSKFCIKCGNDMKSISDEAIVEENSLDAELNEEEFQLDIKDGNHSYEEVDDKKGIQLDVESVNTADRKINDNLEVEETLNNEVNDNIELEAESVTPLDEKMDNDPEKSAEINVLDEIKKAKELLDMGAISEEEFEKIKNKYLELLN